MRNTVEDMVEHILRVVRLSGLDFRIKETPFVAHISVKKKFSKQVSPEFSKLTSDRQICLTNREQQQGNEYEELMINQTKELMNELLQKENEIKKLKGDHIKEVQTLKDIIDEKSKAFTLLKEELEDLEIKLEEMSRCTGSTGRSESQLLHPSDIIDKHLSSQLFFFDTV